MIFKRIVVACVLALAPLPAFAFNLLTLAAITTATSATASPVVRFNGAPRNVTIQAAFSYGSGGTSVDAYVQTSQDNGATWTDIADFHFTTASLRAVYNLSSQTPVTTQYTATDGSLAANTAKDGILGPLFRVKYVTVGTYAGTTTLSVDIATDQTPN